MTTYIATFFSHFGAIRFSKELKAAGIAGTLMPVPRKVSSSCGTCVRFAADVVPNLPYDDVEQLFRQEGEEYLLVQNNL